jgi:hypothetical protein
MTPTNLTLAAVAALAAAGARRRGSRAEEQTSEGYHATHLRNLESIVAQGLRPSSGSSFGQGYSGHSRGRVFLSDRQGAPYWMSKMEQIANYSSDFEDEDMDWQPVLLRVDLEAATGGDVQDDKEGQRDSGSDAFFVEDVIGPQHVHVWTGQRWELVEQADIDSMRQSALAAATYETDEDAGWWLLDFDLFQPPARPQ